ncbi:MAG: DNA-binding domain-containing protein [Gammaproteobacteria bacterium]|jgi:hypothetical protein|nr:DNA-binding domain-containing protein [Gammaproteobacteria bacterium]MBU0773191.1 DNA-binding domain-containing protein [Gammaproteobacteria bacterium]MBU0855440.1 DNA-binding domain-containing protein [Gammaproteobacteria bacterium]MBU1848926.1 DNA-binding domain-containing protein [Gammaproteobacteria bacterium]
MSRLLEAQRLFGAALRNARHEDAALPLLAGDAGRNRALLRIYRGNAVANAGAALALAHPVCRRITGGDYFDALVRRYWADEPSREADLNRYGDTFASFLDNFEPVRELPYLPDVARLEWSVHLAGMAADARSAGGEAFAGLDEEAVAAGFIRATPGFALHDSRWPVADIWNRHQADADDVQGVDLDQPQCAVVWRKGLRVCVAALARGDHAFWAAAQRGLTFGEAWAQGVSADADFNLPAAIAQSLTAGWLQAFDTNNGESR